MKHVNEKIPDVQKRRRDVSSALAAVVERATEKKPEKRYDDMNAMLADLENALEVEVARAGRSTGEATTVLDSVPRRQRIVTSRRVSIAGILLVLAATAAALLIAGLSGDDASARRTGNRRRQRRRRPARRSSSTAAQDFDPEGDNDEHAEEVKLAIDGIPNTTWSTETYTAGPDIALAGKSGVGLIVETAEPVEGQTHHDRDHPGRLGRRDLRRRRRPADRPRRLGRAGRLDRRRRRPGRRSSSPSPSRRSTT